MQYLVYVCFVPLVFFPRHAAVLVYTILVYTHSQWDLLALVLVLAFMSHIFCAVAVAHHTIAFIIIWYHLTLTRGTQSLYSARLFVLGVLYTVPKQNILFCF